MRRVGREKQGSAWFCNGKDRQINALDLHSPDLLRQRNAKSSKGTAMYCIATAKLCLEGNGIASRRSATAMRCYAKAKKCLNRHGKAMTAKRRHSIARPSVATE